MYMISECVIKRRTSLISVDSLSRDMQFTRMFDCQDFVLKNIHIVNPSAEETFFGAVRVVDGVIDDIQRGAFDLSGYAGEVIDGDGKTLIPGLIDISVGFGGGKHTETARQIGLAAASAGVTHIVADPDGSPTADSPSAVDYLRRRAAGDCVVRADICAAITKNTEGETPVEFGLISDAGAVMFSDGDKPFQNTEILARAARYAAGEGALLALHPEDQYLSEGALVAAGRIATLYGLAGSPYMTEVIALERDCRIAELTGVALHIRQISSRFSLPIIERFKQEGLNVSAGVSAHHLLLNDADVVPYKTFLKTAPPIRSEDDRVTLVEGLRTGAINIVTSAHRPRSEDVKRLPFAEADFGCAGVETLLPALLSLYHNGSLGLCEALKPVTVNPARRLGLPGGEIKKGAPADLVLLDLNAPRRILREELKGGCSNTPFENRFFEGAVLKTFIAGKEVYAEAQTESAA